VGTKVSLLKEQSRIVVTKDRDGKEKRDGKKLDKGLQNTAREEELVLVFYSNAWFGYNNL
jgi:hypothetical protein